MTLAVIKAVIISIIGLLSNPAQREPFALLGFSRIALTMGCETPADRTDRRGQTSSNLRGIVRMGPNPLLAGLWADSPPLEMSMRLVERAQPARLTRLLIKSDRFCLIRPNAIASMTMKAIVTRASIFSLPRM